MSDGVGPPETEVPQPLASGPTGIDALIVIGAIVGAFILLIAATLLLSGREGDWGMLVQFAFGNAVMLAGIVALLARHGRRLAALLGLTPLGRRQATMAVLIGAVAGLAMAVGLYMLQTWTGLPIHASQERLLRMPDFSPAEIAIFIVLVGLTTPVIEELVFRGVLFGWLRQRIGPSLGALASAIAFGLLHMPAGQAVWATLFGLLLAILYQRFGSLWAPVLAHAANNCLTLAVVLAAVEGVPT